jgi:transcriptional regulator with XRE-family HTH domain
MTDGSCYVAAMHDTDIPRTRTGVPDPIDLAVGARIRLQRHAIGLSQQALAARLGLSFQQIQKYERGANRVSASMLVKTAQALGCSPALLLVGAEDQQHAADVQWLTLLTQTGATELLAAFSQISDPDTRAAVIAITKGLAAESPRTKACKG